MLEHAAMYARKYGFLTEGKENKMKHREISKKIIPRNATRADPCMRQREAGMANQEASAFSFPYLHQLAMTLASSSLSSE